MKMGSDVIIIGGGLSGLTLAYFLKKKGVNATVLEASERLGGRIYTVTGPLGTALELGATWFSDRHRRLLSLVSELGIQKFVQYSKGVSLFQTKSFEPPQKFFVPEAEAPSYRLSGGTAVLIKKLSGKLPPQFIKLKTKATAVRAMGRELVVETVEGDRYKGMAVVCCLPPQLIASQIEFSPGLPGPVLDILPSVQTWMAGTIKFSLEYGQPFWRKMGYSGMLYSHAGIIIEMYDHTNLNEDRFALTGFLNSGAASYSRETRRELVLRQLSELISKDALHREAYFDKVWNDEFMMGGNAAILRPHQNNGHPVLLPPYMEDRLYFCGTETATEFPGYMEGAVVAAESVAVKLKPLLKF